MMPKPLQPGGVPVWISGTINARVVRRLATFGSGWIPWGPVAGDLGPGIAEMKERLEEAGRDPSGLQVTGALPSVKADDGSLDLDRTMEQVPALAAMGLTDVRGNFRLPDDPSAALDELSRIVAAFRRAAGRTD
jgi:alkanesulfonate monooxygenase SsuD/methylene tetrahydromethanopterin reductase-like flavin-dependent oxidoreductase (luciferase family)